MLEPFVAVTDTAWFEFLSSRAVDGRLDEANFWSPSSSRPMRRMQPGEPVFLRLKSPHSAIAGYGFFAHFSTLTLAEAWTCFGWKNGDANEADFRRRLGRYRREDLTDPRTTSKPLACTVLRDVRFWRRSRWLRWADDEGFARNVVRGAGVRDPVRASKLLGEIQLDGLETPEDLLDDFEPLELDERRIVEVRATQREGQGTFRARLLDAYGRRCAITGERTEPVLDAAHIQPYLGPRSNHTKNGLLLTQEFHTLFDRGYVTVTPDLVVRVSTRLRSDFSNGRRYYAHDGQPLAHAPEPASRPSEAALEWHNARVFLG